MTIKELRESNHHLRVIAHSQQKLVEDLHGRIKTCMGRISELEFQVDDLQQEKLANRVLVTGPAVETFISESAEQRDKIRNLGLHSLNRLRRLVVNKTTPAEMLLVFPQPTAPSPPGAQSDDVRNEATPIQPDPAAQAAMAAEVAASNEEFLKSREKEQGIVSATILSTERIVVHTSSRQAAMAILTRGKCAKRSMFFAEQLTKRRQAVMYRLRSLRSANTRTRFAVFSRNGIPAICFTNSGNGRIHLIRNEDDFADFNNLRGGPLFFRGTMKFFFLAYSERNFQDI